MPIKTNKDTEHHKLISMYVNTNEYNQFLLSLAEHEQPGRVSAAVRTLMYLYIQNDELKRLVSNNINKFVVFNKNGKASKL